MGVINGRDYPEIQGIVLVLSLFVCLVNLVVDLVYAAADPRIKAQFSGGPRRKKPVSAGKEAA